ncbi:unnamed protein product [Rotaria sp. Silwood1]|nr:unnamed protein product [Rotaria sp. Silwood1]CAF0762700.1 unnamed protein product [Rotaria sp. Silwood1]CAF3319001.1 unnamed protein product [Rotaria sp. Silwood1]CAF3335629.1 unnamed protein product [Rotaria sp. Silwood1]CAF3343024.1 unnamed protein product [Rotaria sp. Silwood1]
MAQNKRAEARRRRPIHIECPICTDEETTSSTYPLTYTLPDVGEETTFDYQGTPINISVQSLIETKRLGFGSFGFVRLVEVKDHPDIKMAVKVS